MAKNSVPIRIDSELVDILREIAEKNEISVTQASRELARMNRRFKGNKVKEIREILF